MAAKNKVQIAPPVNPASKVNDTANLNWLELIVDGLEEVLFSVDHNWCFTWLNRRAASEWQRSRESLIGKVIWEEFPTLTGSSFAAHYQRAMTSGVPVQFEEFSRTVERWYEVRAYPVPQGLIIYYRDVTRRKEVEFSLQESENRFHLLADSAPVLIWTAGTDALCDYFNRTWLEFTGRTLEEEQGNGWTVNLHPEDYLSCITTYLTAFETRKAFRREYRLRRADGEYRYVLDNGVPRFSPDGTFAGYSGSCVDITDYKEAQARLVASQYRYQVLTEATLEGILFHQDGVIIEANQSMAMLLGFHNAGELIGQSIYDFLTPTSREVAWQQATNGYEQAYEIVMVRRDGREVIVEVHGRNVEYRGQLARQGAFRDITARKEAEAKLRESEERFRVLSEAAFDAVFIEEAGSVIEVNQAATLLSGYSRAELEGSQFLELVTVREPVGEAVSYNDGSTFEASLLKKDGTVIPVEGRGKPVVYQGRVVTVVSVRDISDRYALLKTQKQLLEAQKLESIGRLAGGIAHDFNNLLTVITGYSELGQLLPDISEEVRDVFSEIQEAGERAASLTRQLLAFSRRQLLEPRIVDLNELIRGTDRMLGRLIGEEIALVTTAEASAATVLADPGQLEQVIVNLVVNARDAINGANGGKITLETATVELDEHYQLAGYPQFRPGRYVLLAVSDNGSGMNETTRARIFEPFFTTKAVGNGTGLGLSTVYGIVRQSEGYILVYSKVGVGTTFKLYLPLAQAKAESELNLPEAGLPEGGAGERIVQHPEAKVLVVEDEAMVRELIRQVLDQAGYQVKVVSNGQAALEEMASSEKPPDLVLTDIVMPEMGGYELVTELKARWPGLQIIGMSGYTDQAVARHELLHEYDNFLQKPFTRKLLLQKVAEVLST